jgi:hypothetical protein
MRTRIPAVEVEMGEGVVKEGVALRIVISRLVQSALG